MVEVFAKWIIAPTGHGDMETLAENAEIDEKFYEVERILGHKSTKEGLFYLVRWKGYTKADDSWEPAKNLSLATDAILHYESSKKVIPKRVQKGNEKRAEKDTKINPSQGFGERTKYVEVSFFTQAWLYENNSEEESEVEKEHKKRTKQRKLAAEQRERVGEEDKPWEKEKEKSFEGCSNIKMSNKCKWQTETNKRDNRQETKAAIRDELLDKIKREVPSEESVNGVAGAVANEDNVDEQIFAIGKTSDGRIKGDGNAHLTSMVGIAGGMDLNCHVEERPFHRSTDYRAKTRRNNPIEMPDEDVPDQYWKNLLAITTKASAESGSQNIAPRPMSNENRKWLENVMKELVKESDPGRQMDAIITSLHSYASNPAELNENDLGKIEELTDHLEDILGYAEITSKFVEKGGLLVIETFLCQREHFSLQCRFAELVLSLTENNPVVQSLFARKGLLTKMMKLLDDDSYSEEFMFKLLGSISGSVRSHIESFDIFCANGGPKLLTNIVRKAESGKLVGKSARVLTTIAYTLEDSPCHVKLLTADIVSNFLYVLQHFENECSSELDYIG
ncbi:unnamed protein product [Angiostrongylus costaricensis]|uniref:Chromo domain-containing protein n=1 Tax=Angiostrongylus costaricensis TaxID=334426 RepID=A0A158PDX9_ANGCS|nr:unnamed protein product [Angiostrongylus costaricensis]